MQANAPRHTPSPARPGHQPALRRLKFGLFATAALLGALHVIERSGLPAGWTFPAALCLLLGLGLMLVASERTFDEADFTLDQPLLPDLGGGALLGLFAGVILPLLLRPANGSEVMALIAGGSLGILAAHGLLRVAGTTPAALLHASGRSGPGGFVMALLALLLLVPAGLVMIHVLPIAVREMAALTGWSLRAATLLTTALFIYALVLGGGRALLGGLGVAVTLVGVTILLLLGEGFAAFGGLPLPGLTSDATLGAIAEARVRWVGTGVQPPLLPEWPGLRALVAGSALNLMVIALLLGALVGRSLSPAINLHRRRAAAMAITACVGCILAGIAAGGYAVEAAGSQLVGASLDRAPQRLLDSTAAGLIRICGAMPTTLEGLRAACGITGRGAVLSFDQLALEPRFLWSGLPQAMGLTGALSAAPRALPTLFALMALFWAGWIIALALGRGLFAYGQWGPGQASQRLAYVRVAGVLGISLAAMMTDTAAAWPDRQVWLLAGGVGVLALLLDFGLRRRDAPALPSDVASASQPRVRSPRGKTAQL